MIRSTAHLLLVLVVPACLVQCAIASDMYCASKSTKVEAAAEQTCSTTNDVTITLTWKVRPQIRPATLRLTPRNQTTIAP